MLAQTKGWQERWAQPIMNINTALPLQARNQMLRGMDWWNFGGADVSIAPTWFGLRYARLKVVVLQRTVVSRFGCSVFEFWVLRFRDLGAPFSSFGCFVFEIWLLLASVFRVFECFVFETTAKNHVVVVMFCFGLQSIARFINTNASYFNTHRLESEGKFS